MLDPTTTKADIFLVKFSQELNGNENGEENGISGYDHIIIIGIIAIISFLISKKQIHK